MSIFRASPTYKLIYASTEAGWRAGVKGEGQAGLKFGKQTPLSEANNP
jgi:hypothetical protein